MAIFVVSQLTSPKIGICFACLKSGRLWSSFSIFYRLMESHNFTIVFVCFEDRLKSRKDRCCSYELFNQSMKDSHIVWVGCAAGFAKVLPFTRPNFASFVTLYQTRNAQLFLFLICS